MWPFSQWTTAGRAALTYITIGALTVIWAGVWYIYLLNNPGAESTYYWCGGFLVTGFTVLLIGLGLGIISRSAPHADLPAAGVPMALNAAPASSPVLAPLNLASALAAPNGQAVHSPAEEPFAEIVGGNR